MKIRYLLSIATLTLLAGVTSAGVVQPAAVVVDLDNMFAQGDQVTARTAKNDVEFIGCGIRVFDGGFTFGFCQASDSDGVEQVCFTENADLLDAMKATSAYAFITFGWDETDECTRIGFSTQSIYLPNFTTKGSK